MLLLLLMLLLLSSYILIFPVGSLFGHVAMFMLMVLVTPGHMHPACSECPASLKQCLAKPPMVCVGCGIWAQGLHPVNLKLKIKP